MDKYKYLKYKNKYINLKNQLGGSRTYYIQAGDIHKQIKKDIYESIIPGTRIYDIYIMIRELIKKYNATIPFPPCISVSNMIAHNTPFKEDMTQINYNDMVTVDYGVNINGYIVDGAFSVYYDPELKPLYDATIEGINIGIKTLNIDTPINEIGAAIQEVVESYEINYKGTLYPLKIVKDLSGHSIERYNVHGNIRIPNIKNEDTNRITSGTYAIEPLVCIMTDRYIPYQKTNSFTIDNNYFSIEDKINENIKQEYNLISPFENDRCCHFEHSIYLDKDNKIILT